MSQHAGEPAAPAAVAKGFVDDLDTVVAQSLSGLTRCSGNTLKHLTTPASSGGSGDGGAVHVVVRADFEEHKAAGKVAIISGGGAGHEPLHAGFVGPDMLTAAVSGDVFASPSTDAVLHAIVTVTGTGGCLVVVKNYTGDRLNFGLAIERARALHGLRVEMVVVADDVALPDLAQPRGIAGTCLVHKVAGYAADTLGRDLAHVTRVAQATADSVKSMGVSLSVCSIPGQPLNPRLSAAASYELGLGIHGEPGAKSGAMAPVSAAGGSGGGDSAVGGASAVLHELADTLLRNGGLNDVADVDGQKPRFALLVNNLGAVPPLYLHAVAENVLQYLQKHHGLFAAPAGGIVMVGAYVTSLDMNGVSLSLLRTDAAPEVEAALLHPVTATGWTPARVFDPDPTHHAVPSHLTTATAVTAATSAAADAGPLLAPAQRSRLVTAMKHLESIAAQLDEWDGLVGDGDCGRTVAKGARAVGHAADRLPADPAQLCSTVAEALKGMGGSFGVLLCIFFSAAAAAIAQRSEAEAPAAAGSASDGGGSASVVTTGFAAGLAAVRKYGGAAPGGCTMVDALCGAHDAAVSAGRLSDANVWQVLARGAKRGMETTKAASKAAGGRAMYQTKDLSGIPDPGAFAVYTLLEQLAS